MLRSFIFSALCATSALGYRISEYTGERCTGSEVGLHRLAGPSGCDNLNHGVASSLFVKIDNIHDEQYAVNVYDKDDCGGSIVGHIHNANGCLNLAPFSTVGKSIRVVPAKTSAKMRNTPDASASEKFETDYLYNLRALKKDQIKVPIAHGLFRTADKTNHTEDGFYADEAFGMFWTTDPQQVSSIQKLWTTPSVEDNENEHALAQSSTSDLASSNITDTKQFEWAYCNFEALCLGAVTLSYKVSKSETVRAVAQTFHDHRWSAVAKGFDFVVTRAANGITIFGSISGSGDGSPGKCDSTGSPSTLVKHLINSAKSEDLTNAVWQIRNDDGSVWEVSLRLYEGEKENPDNCGACPTCL